MKEIAVKKMTKDCYQPGDKIIIYGAGAFGEIAYKGLEYLKLPLFCFADRALAGQCRYGKPVISPDELKEYTGASIILASQNYFGEMKDHLQKLGFTVCYDIRDFFGMLPDTVEMTEYAKDMFENPEKYMDAVSYHSSGSQLYIPRLELVVTECCTLKCRHCATLTPYYKNPGQIHLQECAAAMDVLLHTVSYISELRLLGGEPFLNNMLADYINAFGNHPKIGMIHIYTNGTVLPGQKIMESMVNKKVKVHISDYGTNTAQIETLTGKLKEYGIHFTLRRYDYWCDFGKLEYRGYTREKRQKIFDGCLAKNCHTLIRNRLYRCSRAANADNTGLCPVRDHEVIQLDHTDMADESLPAQIRKLLMGPEILSTCDYCSGMDYIHNLIPAAEQIDHGGM